MHTKTGSCRSRLRDVSTLFLIKTEGVWGHVCCTIIAMATREWASVLQNRRGCRQEYDPKCPVATAGGGRRQQLTRCGGAAGVRGGQRAALHALGHGELAAEPAAQRRPARCPARQHQVMCFRSGLAAAGVARPLTAAIKSISPERTFLQAERTTSAAGRCLSQADPWGPAHHTAHQHQATTARPCSHMQHTAVAALQAPAEWLSGGRWSRPEHLESAA